jgi:Galactose oxidase, central domain
VKFIFSIGTLLIPVLIACKKERIKNTAALPGNNAPIANAGPDLRPVITTFKLDGSLSADPGGEITNWEWRKITGPGDVFMNTAFQQQTNVNVNFFGFFQFELLVKDREGIYDKDTVNVFCFQAGYFCDTTARQIMNSRFVPVWRFPFERTGISVTTHATKVYFAGGRGHDIGSLTNQVVILDMETKTESMATLSIPRAFIGSITAGNKLFFAGGWVWSNAVSRVEMVDILSGTSSIAELSEARWGLATAVLGNKVFFAGGFYYNGSNTAGSSRVDIYDISTNTWSVANLSEARGEIAATVYDNKIYFAGGNKVTAPSAAIDIYDGNTNLWGSSSLNTAVANPGAIIADGKMYTAGGYTLTGTAGGGSFKQPVCRVEIKSLNDQSVSVTGLSFKTSSVLVNRYNNRITFFPAGEEHSNFFDVFNLSTGSWSTGLIVDGLRNSIGFVYKNDIYIAGGYFGSSPVGPVVFNDQIMKLEIQ